MVKVSQKFQNSKNLISYVDKVIEWLILGIIFFIPICFDFFGQSFNVFALSKTIIFRIAVSLLLILTLSKFHLTEKIEISRNNRTILFLLLFILVAIISTLGSVFPELSFWGNYYRQQGLFSILYYFAFFVLIILNIKSWSNIKKIIWSMVLSSAILGLYGLAQYLQLDPYAWDWQGTRIFASIGQPNFFAYYLLFVIPVTAYTLLCLVKKNILRFLVLVLLVIQIISLALAWSRGAWLGLFFSVGFFIMIYLFLIGYRKIFYSILAILVLAPILFIANYQTIAGKLKTIKQEDNMMSYRLASAFYLDGGANQARFIYWQAALNEFYQANWDRKIIGFGKDTQERLYAKRYQPVWGVYEKPEAIPDRAHNSILDILLEFGLLGLTTLLLFVGYITYSAGQWLLLNRENKGQKYWLVVSLLTALAGYGLASLFSFPETVNSVYWYLVLALLWLAVSDSPSRHYWSLKKINHWSRCIVLAALILFLVFFVYYFGYKSYLADHYYRLSTQAQNNSDCQGMINYMNQAVDVYPVELFYKAQYILAANNCLAYMSDKKTVVDITSNVIDQIDSLSPKEFRYEVLLEIARAYSLFGYYVDEAYYDKAEQAYQKIFEVFPAVSSVYADYGRMKVWSKEYDRAIEIYQKGLDMSAPLKLDNGQEAVYHEDIKISQALFYQLIGDAYYSKNDLLRAKQAYMKSLEINPLFVDVYRKIADLYYLSGNLDEAINYNNKAYHLDNLNVKWPLNIAILYQELGDSVNAREYANLALQIDPGSKKAQDIINSLAK